MGVGLLPVGFTGLSKALIFVFFSALTVVIAVGLVTEGISTGERCSSSQEIVVGARDGGILIGGIFVISGTAGSTSVWSSEFVTVTLPSESVRLASHCCPIGIFIDEVTSISGARGVDWTSEGDLGVGDA
jgi:hypothetical protein